jgi:hypothetical protein
MTYRDLDGALQARIVALEAEIQELRQALSRASEHERASVELRTELEIERAQRMQQVQLFGAERRQHERTMETIQEQKIQIAESRARADVERARAETRFAQTNAELHQRELTFAERLIVQLLAEIEAVSDGPERARLFYQTRIAEVRAALHSAEASSARHADELSALERDPERSRDDASLTVAQRDAALAHASRLREELARLKNALAAEERRRG